MNSKKNNLKPRVPNPAPSVVAAAVAPPTNPQPQKALAIRQELKVTSGPLPSADELAVYDRTLPGAAHRIVAMAESEMTHRHEIEVLATQANIQAQQRQLDIANYHARSVEASDVIGQILGWLISVAAVAGAFYLGLHGQTVAACAMAALPIAGIIQSLRSRNVNRATRKEQRTDH